MHAASFIHRVLRGTGLPTRDSVPHGSGDPGHFPSKPGRSRAGLLSPTLAALILAFAAPLSAAPVAHPDRPDRLVETRDGFSVEYSPGQEAWMEMAFDHMRTGADNAATNPATTPEARPPLPGSAQYLHDNRGLILAAVARQVGLPKPTKLQGRVFDTFLGYYKITSEMMQAAGRSMPATLAARNLAIWQRDDLVARLRAGTKIEGMTYDPATDSGHFGFYFNLNSGVLGERLREIHAEIEAQKLNHQFNQNRGIYSASVAFGKTTDEHKMVPKTLAPADDLGALFSAQVFPIIYKSDGISAPMSQMFHKLEGNLADARVMLEQMTTYYRDPSMVTIILHETAETGLIENLIASPDRRWLCDGTANYVAWLVARDLFGAEFARQVYDLDAQLRLHAASQPKIDLARWSAVEHQKEGEGETDLNRAHYAFAARAMFVIAERHGDNALAQLWADVARTPKKKVSAKTFASAYRKRFKGDLTKLIREAEQKPIPAAIAQHGPKS
jgi:hypothetical protein